MIMETDDGVFTKARERERQGERNRIRASIMEILHLAAFLLSIFEVDILVSFHFVNERR